MAEDRTGPIGHRTPEGNDVAVIGLGYVGTVTAACLASTGARVVGVEIEEQKVAAINAGRPAFSEPGLGELVERTVADGRLSATTSLHDGLRRTRTWFVTVGTPSGPDGDADLRAVHRVISSVADVVPTLDEPPLLVLTSTVPPGTSETVVLPTLREHGLEVGHDLHFAYSPEFLREGNAVADYVEPARTVLGTGTDSCRAAAQAFFQRLDPSPLHVDIATAEFAKYTDNTWHALKVAFANEMARVGHALGVDPRAAMDLFVQDDRLNISPAYLKPGFAFGGSCLPKDVRTLTARARRVGVGVPVVDALLASNDAHVAHAVRTVAALAPKRVAVVGLAFKSGTDDLRESPALPLVRQLSDPSREVVVYDPLIDPVRLHGANALQLMRDLPEHHEVLTDDLGAVLDSDVVVITQRGGLGKDVAARLAPEQVLVDVGGALSADDTPARYVGLAWP